MAASLENRIYITGKEVMDRWQIGPADLRFYLFATVKDWSGDVYLKAQDPNTLKTVLSDRYFWEGKETTPPGDALTIEEGLRKHEIEHINTADYDLYTPEVALEDLLFWVNQIKDFEKQHKLFPPSEDTVPEPMTVPVNLKNRVFLSVEEVLKRWQISWDDLMVYICPEKGKLYLPAISPDGPQLLIEDMEEWAKLPEGKELTFYVEDVLKFEKQKNLVVYDSEEISDSEASINGKELQELGQLREEKKKWDISIRAAVYAALFCQGKEIKHDELTGALHQFHLPDTTQERIWKALRDKGLTKKAGRPRKSTD
jgi:hypothetical protein